MTTTLSPDERTELVSRVRRLGYSVPTIANRLGWTDEYTRAVLDGKSEGTSVFWLRLQNWAANLSAIQ